MPVRKINGKYYFYYIDSERHQHSVPLGDGPIGEITRRSRILQKNLEAAKFLRSQRKFTNIVFGVAPASPQNEAIQSQNEVVQSTTYVQTRRLPAISEKSQPQGLKMSDVLKTVERVYPLTEAHRKEFRKFAEFAKVETVAQLTPKLCLEYLTSRYGGEGAHGKRFNNAKSLLNTIFKHCLVEAEIMESPFAPIQSLRIENVQPHRPLTEDEFRRAFEAADEPWKTMALISWHTALRLESCQRLSWSMIDEERRTITILPGKTARFNRSVVIPIHPELWNWLKSISRPADDNVPIASQWKMVREYRSTKKTYFVGLLQTLGIKDTDEGKASFHSLRVSFVTRCSAAGISRDAVKGVVGHVSDDQTDYYNHDHESARAILKLPSVGIALDN